MRRVTLPIIVFTIITALGIVLFQVIGETRESKPEKIRGVSWVGGDSVDIDNFKPLIKNHVNWIVQTPFAWMDSPTSSRIKMANGEAYYWGESDQGIEHTVKLAKKQGIRTLLKPHIWMNPRKGKWRADIKMESDSTWNLWFRDYEKFILHYAQLAERNKIESLCIGTELYFPSTRRTNDFRKLIIEIRKVYSGDLVYAANWYKEFEEIEFWDDLDYIGVQAYFPLSHNENPSLEELLENWSPHLEKIRLIAEKYNKKVLFTEVGYRSMANAAIEPWVWPDNSNTKNMESSAETQAICYEALFQTFWDENWFAGTFIWKWFPHNDRTKSKNPNGFTPQHKPAESVIRKYYQSSSSRSSIRMAD